MSWFERGISFPNIHLQKEKSVFFLCCTRSRCTYSSMCIPIPQVYLQVWAFPSASHSACASVPAYLTACLHRQRQKRAYNFFFSSICTLKTCLDVLYCFLGVWSGAPWRHIFSIFGWICLRATIGGYYLRLQEYVVRLNETPFSLISCDLLLSTRKERGYSALYL